MQFIYQFVCSVDTCIRTSVILKRWPRLLLKYSLDEPPDWLKEFRTCFMVCCAVRELVSQLSPRFYKLDEVPDDGFAEVVALMEKHDAPEVIISELNEIIHDNERFKANNYLMLHGTLFCQLLVFCACFN